MADPFDRVTRDLDKFLENMIVHADDFAYELKTSIVSEVVHTGSIDTARMIQAINYHREIVSTVGSTFRIDTSDNDEVTYDGFVDRPIARNAFGFEGGRLFYQTGIEKANIGRVADEIADMSFSVVG